MIDTIISAFLQVAVFTLIPFVVYWISKRKVKGFGEYIGWKRSNRRANTLALLTSLVFVVPALILTAFNEGFREIMTGPKSVSGGFREMEFGAPLLIMIGLKAVFTTALSEEILFRGFLAKRLIAWLGYSAGNLVQALIFGGLHLALFAAISSNWFFLIFIFTFSGLGAYISAYLNEKLAGGSIVPGWIAHAVANLISYTMVAFVF